MKTFRYLCSISLGGALFCLVAGLPGTALSADPPARKGFFSRLGSAISHVGERVLHPKETRTGPAHSDAGPSGGRPVMKTDAHTDANPPATEAPAQPAAHHSEAKPSRTASETSDAHPAGHDDASAKTKTGTEPAKDKDKDKEYPVATFIRSGLVKSPLPPYNVLDVSGMPSGSLAKDPASGQIFKLP